MPRRDSICATKRFPIGVMATRLRVRPDLLDEIIVHALACLKQFCPQEARIACLAQEACKPCTLRLTTNDLSETSPKQRSTRHPCLV